MKKTLLFLIPTLFSGAVMAKAGESTLSMGYIQIRSDGLKKDVNLLNQSNKLAGDAISNSLGVSARVDSDNYSNPGGAFIRYTYELNDGFGVIGSASYSESDFSTSAFGTTNKEKDSSRVDGRVKGKYISLMVGPTYRFNEYVNAYALVGLANKKMSYEFGGNAFKNGKLIKDEKRSNSDSRNDLAYGVGMQVNVYEGVTVDAGYERSGSGDWKTDAFTVGLGYKF
ncbi:Ail/Lom family outer membrane beta-barrel protein [Arsenophonus apicola]|uniref:Ail/Lom family outer membrane beta-barrel protein n=1 Tax=Arsenophonus apicola TaxID=2879119 RepID=A0ABY8NZI7_9GAMM|nr:Ail/Lom family outer membrane beta-barrel protein [Arsenophonus apicola]WGO82357.1 Ail/Lom family outer membrane beta-barrel protein [Arsenophonus apicola]